MVSIDLILYSWVAGFTVFLGGLLANIFEQHVNDGIIKEYVIHAFLAFGSGILLSAVALVLIPKGMEQVNLAPLLMAFVLGLFVFSKLDMYLEAKGGQLGALMAMLMDFIPEAIALGALFAVEPQVAVLLAVFIGMQNLPEAFNAYRELALSGLKGAWILVIFFLLSFVGVISAIVGQLFLSGQPDLTAMLMLFASAGILYLLFNDLAPAIKMNNSVLPARLAVLGFLFGMVGEKLI